MHDVLTVPEILRSILLLVLNPIDNLAAACVCRAWTHSALDALYYEVHGLAKLFSKLAPMVQKTSSQGREELVSDSALNGSSSSWHLSPCNLT